MERDIQTTIYSQTIRHFNSHAHVERDLFCNSPFITRIISTHTLTWSVTTEDCPVNLDDKNFNSHAHVERDILTSDSHRGREDFNSHAHVERDRNDVEKTVTVEISTHTLTWSVT
mgnify:CR=1 FL=1